MEMKCGKFRFEVTPQIRRAIEGVIYWVHCQRLDAAELRAAEKPGSRYTEQEITDLRRAVAEEELSVRDFMTRMDELDVPNWLGNGAIAWAEANDLRIHSMREFFERSRYAS